jgi:hypothetical protein
MAGLDTAIQEKPKYFNDPGWPGRCPAMTEESDFDFFTLSNAGLRCDPGLPQAASGMTMGPILAPTHLRGNDGPVFEGWDGAAAPAST